MPKVWSISCFDCELDSTRVSPVPVSLLDKFDVSNTWDFYQAVDWNGSLLATCQFLSR
jgi:hypothetical protein